MAGPGIVEWFGGGDRPGHRCGYCGNSDTNVSDGMWAHKLTVQDYQDLIDRGWRRSGKYCYKPKMNTTCCPHYTIKQDALNFKLNKSHKKIIKQVNKFLIHGKKQEEASQSKSSESKGEEPSQTEVSHHDDETVSSSKGKSEEMETEKVKKIPRPGAGADPEKPKCRKAKDIRRERKLSKQMEKGEEESTKSPGNKSKNSGEKSLEEFLSEPDKEENCAHKLEIRLVRSEPASKQFEDSFDEAHSVYHSYQMKIHNDPPEKPNVRQYTRFLCNSPLEVKLVRVNPRSDAFESSFDESYSIFKKYQMTIHREREYDCDQSQFVDFLVEGPLEEEHREGGLPSGYGSFHQQYLLDGKIIAVGVIDILPNCVSSVYLYYHPDYNFLSLGTYSALREIAFVRELNKKAPDLIYYYMGYYIHSCPKMKYKGQYHPSFLLCPEVYTWHPIQECSQKLDNNKYSRFAEKGKEDEGGVIDLNNVQILHKRMHMSYEQYKQLNRKKDKDSTVRKYSSFVGRSCAERMLLYLD